MAYENCSAGRFHRDVINDVMDCAVEFGYRAEDECRAYEDLEKGFRPDVVLVLTKKRVKFRVPKIFVEVQWDDTPGWRRRMEKQYAGKKYFVIPLKKLNSFKESDRRHDSETRYKQVREYVDINTTCMPGQKLKIKVKKPCRWCGRELYNTWSHEKTCRGNPDRITRR